MYCNNRWKFNTAQQKKTSKIPKKSINQRTIEYMLMCFMICELSKRNERGQTKKESKRGREEEKDNDIDEGKMQKEIIWKWVTEN